MYVYNVYVYICTFIFIFGQLPQCAPLLFEVLSSVVVRNILMVIVTNTIIRVIGPTLKHTLLIIIIFIITCVHTPVPIVTIIITSITTRYLRA